ncbi:hypothetical protein HPP92_005555 [Vanilla planifolia]|uniref:Uncharacterized protein n=1 Tax=Vanilla planifolia TaxID=51239 RepID=A0A835VFI2_VANPL|nr:hypothetical protein HPP92_005555 [Vanilla planifolia]
MKHGTRRGPSSVSAYAAEVASLLLRLSTSRQAANVESPKLQIHPPNKCLLCWNFLLKDTQPRLLSATSSLFGYESALPDGVHHSAFAHQDSDILERTPQRYGVISTVGLNISLCRLAERYKKVFMKPLLVGYKIAAGVEAAMLEASATKIWSSA